MDSPTLISRETLARRWEVSVQTVIKYETDGIITRVPSIPSPRYSISEISKIEGIQPNLLSPLERRRLEGKVDELEEKVRKQAEHIRKMSILAMESMNILSN
ncbi:transcription factor [Clostridium sp. LP20]|uniref:transcription factor n=1 Tax=Clostridium sp. LP20 TaxID=3418665 RepID=UPI003EE572A9